MVGLPKCSCNTGEKRWHSSGTGSVPGCGGCCLWSRQATPQYLPDVFSFTSPGKWVGTPVSSSPRWVGIGGVEGPWFCFQLLDVCFFLSLWKGEWECECSCCSTLQMVAWVYRQILGPCEQTIKGNFSTLLVAVLQLFFFSFIDTILLCNLSCSQLLENFLYSSPLLSCLDRPEDIVGSECDPPITIQWSIGCFKKS